MGRPGGVELRLHVLWPLLALVTLLAIKESLVDGTVALWALTIFFSSATLHELSRVLTATRVGGHPSALVLGPIGGLTKLHLPADPPSHLVAALSGPMTYLVLLVSAGCGLTLLDEQSVLQLLLHPFAPDILHPGPGVISPISTLQQVAQLTVWINWCLLLLSLLPVAPCDGADLLHGLLWPMVGRSTAATTTSRIALATALLVAMLATLAPDHSSGSIPTWFPLSVIAVFLFYGGYRNNNARYYDVGLVDAFDSDDEEWLLSVWEDEECEAVLVEHLQDKQQEVLDRKRHACEENEDARVDAILLRLRDTSFEQLSEEDRATLKRASRRYRERREESDEGA